MAKRKFEPIPVQLIESNDPRLPKIYVKQFEMGEFIRLDVIFNGYKSGVEMWPTKRGMTLTFLKGKGPPEKTD